MGGMGAARRIVSFVIHTAGWARRDEVRVECSGMDQPAIRGTRHFASDLYVDCWSSDFQPGAFRLWRQFCFCFSIACEF